MLEGNVSLVKSRFIQSVTEDDYAVIWHSLFGKPKIISVETLRFIDNFIKP